MTIRPGPRFGIAGGGDNTNNRPTTSGGISGPFRARRGFDAHNHKGVNFEDPDLPQNLANPSGDGEVVNTNYFWDHANFIRWDGRAGFLPDPLTTEIAAGEQYAIRMDFGGRFLGRIAVWDSNLQGPAEAEIPAGTVFPVNDLGSITTTNSLDFDNAAILFLSSSTNENAGDFVTNASGVDHVIPAGVPLEGQVLPDGARLIRLGTDRIGYGGYGIILPIHDRFWHLGSAAVGVTPGNWRYLNTLTWLKALAADPDQPTDVKSGDAQYTLEAQGKELKVWDDGAWHKIYSEIDVRAWIAALSLFEGTVQEVGGTAANVPEFGALPDLALNNQIDKIAHYWTFTGTPGYTIQATDPSGVGRDLPGTILNPGDWLQVSNRSGDVNAPDLRWSHVGGDLLAKSRGDNLYGLQPWTAGGWEIGSLVVHDQSIWRATGPVTAADPEPGTPGAPWAQVTLAAGIRWVSTDGDLPADAPTGEIYFVLQSATAGGSGALFYWDAGADAWSPLGGAGGQPMDLSSGYPALNIGLPVGAITMWAVANPPPGWLICDGSAFSAGTYPELAAVLGTTNVPNLAGQFVRGADAGNPLNSRKGWTTGRSRTAMTGTAGSAGSPHQHRSPVHNYATGWKGGGSADYVLARMGYGADGNANQMRFTKTDGAHTHPVSITEGGDLETAPDHVCLHYVIKAMDLAVRVRI